MMDRKPIGLVLLLLGTLAGCREEDGPIGPGENTRLEVTSDPAGANIFLDNEFTGKVTPDLLRDIIGRHEILVRLDRSNVSYGYRTEVQIRGDSLHRVAGPLTMRCVSTECHNNEARSRTVGRMRVSTNPNGSLFFVNGTGGGLHWPSFGNTYAAMGLPLIGMITSRQPADTLALGIYDYGYLAGRPAPVVTEMDGRYSLRQSFWIVPPTGVIVTGAPTVRGIEVEEELIGTSGSDVAFVKLTFRNITNRASYQAADPLIPAAGMRFDQVYVGFALDADIGNSDDDVLTYEPALDMVYIYDSNFREDQFNPGTTTAPGLVGLRILQAPGAVKVLNGWPSLSTGGGDWQAGVDFAAEEPIGWGVISGVRSFLPDFAGQTVGHTPTNAGDYRMLVSTGPLTLAPGDAASITVAVILALPVSGSYTSGQAVPPGNPTDQNRQIRSIAADLIDRAGSLVVP